MVSIEFADLVDYIQLDVFKYLSLIDRIKFERLNKHCKLLLRNSTTDLETFGRGDDDREEDAIDSKLRELLARRFPNLSVLPFQTFSDIDYRKQEILGRLLAECCPKLTEVSWSFREYEHLFVEYNLAHDQSQLQSLTISTVYDTFFNWSKLRAAVEKSQLTELSVVKSERRSANRDELQQFLDYVSPRITKLYFSFLNLDVQQLNKFCNLVEFEYSAGNFVRNSSNLVLNLPKLKKLHFHGQLSADLIHLTGLTVFNGWLNDQNAELVFKLIKNNQSTLVGLAFHAEATNPEFFAVVKNCSKLRKFVYSCPYEGCDLESPKGDVEFLSKNPRIQVLVIKWKVLREVSQLEEVLKLLPKLQTLSIYIHVGQFDNLGPWLQNFEDVLVNYASLHPKRRIEVEYFVQWDQDENNHHEPLPFKVINNLTLKDTMEKNEAL